GQGGWGSGSVGRILFGTESCLPLYPLQEICRRIFTLPTPSPSPAASSKSQFQTKSQYRALECSWLAAYHTPQGTWEAGTCFRAVGADIVPPKAVCKSLPGWVLLTRKHAAEVLALAGAWPTHTATIGGTVRAGAVGVGAVGAVAGTGGLGAGVRIGAGVGVGAGAGTVTACAWGDPVRVG
ncbi:hypothetical protein B484DRAFT_414710, partial [Ochromonadaceae sp. CCMP2298]